MSMNRFVRFGRALAVGSVAVAATLSMTQVANAEPAGPTLPKVAENIAVPEGNKVFLVGHATGVQIYKCNGTAWAFVAPRADLFDDNGKLIVTHFAGPTWKAKDGSMVVGSVEARATPDATAIPWLRLKTTPTPAGSDGGRLGKTTFIQRVATTDGLVPTDVCNTTTVDKVAEVPYTADYYFWKRTGKPGT
jgi:hypothetical protein